MVKWVVLWDLPEGRDPEEWERWYRDVHVPIASRLPKMRRYTVGKCIGGPEGVPRFGRMAEQYFDNEEDLWAAVNSPAGKAVVDDAGPNVARLHLMVCTEGEVAPEAEN